jgi:exosome complex component CSL4
MIKDIKKIVLPGDKVATPEEFSPGRNVYEMNGLIRSLLVGRIVRDLTKREVHIESPSSSKIPIIGNHIIGQIESVQSNFASVRIYYLNGKETEGGFSGILFFKNDRPRGMKKTLVKLGDIVRAKVVGTLNAIIQLSIDDLHSGVIFSVCGNCGKNLIRNNEKAKCIECGSIEERKFTDDFGEKLIEL